jgi:hypothetical protein
VESDLELKQEKVGVGDGGHQDFMNVRRVIHLNITIGLSHIMYQIIRDIFVNMKVQKKTIN